MLAVNGSMCLGLCTISSKINGTPKGVRLSEKLLHSGMKFDRRNKFDLCDYEKNLTIVFESNSVHRSEENCRYCTE